MNPSLLASEENGPFSSPDLLETSSKTLKLIIDLQNLLATNTKAKKMMIGFNDLNFKKHQARIWFDEDNETIKPLLEKLLAEFKLSSIGLIQKAAPGYNNEYIFISNNQAVETNNELLELLEARMAELDAEKCDFSPQKSTGVYIHESQSESCFGPVVIPCSVNNRPERRSKEDETFGYIGFVPTKEQAKAMFNPNSNGHMALIAMIANQLGLYFSHLNLLRKKALNDRLKKTIDTIDTRFSFLENPNDSDQILSDLADFINQVFDFHSGAVYTYIRDANIIKKEVSLNKNVPELLTEKQLLDSPTVIDAIKKTNYLDNTNRQLAVPVRYVFPLTSTFTKSTRALILFDSEKNTPLTRDEADLISNRLKDKVGFHLQSAENFENRITSISDFEELLKNISNPDVMQDKMINVIAKHLKVDIISYMEVDPSKKYITFKKGQGQSKQIKPGTVRELAENSISGLAIKYGKTVYIKNVDDLEEVKRNFPEENIEELRKLFASRYKTTYNTKSLLSVPLIAGKGTASPKILGVINVNNKDNKKVFSEKDKEFLEAIAELVATGINNVNFIDEGKQRELLNKGANDIQMSLMPKNKDFKRLPKEVDVFGESTPAKEVGGDLFEIVKMKDGRLLAIIGDVSGKGTPAAIIMAIAQTIIKTLAPDEDNLINLLQKTNKYLSDELEEMDGKFVTLQLVAIDVTTGRGEFANAGHSPLLICRNNKIDTINTSKGMPLGLFYPPIMPYSTLKFQMKPGDFFVMFTDGLYEELSPDGEMFGMERIAEIMESNSDKDSKNIYSALEQAFLDWKKGADAHDDLTILSFKYKGKQIND